MYCGLHIDPPHFPPSGLHLSRQSIAHWGHAIEPAVVRHHGRSWMFSLWDDGHCKLASKERLLGSSLYTDHLATMAQTLVISRSDDCNELYVGDAFKAELVQNPPARYLTWPAD